ncbi:hypothetical protein Tco_0195367 [Tanacetum coccineum]
MPLLDTMLPPAQAAIAGESSREDAPSNPQTVPATITELDHSHDHESTQPRPTTTASGALVTERGPSSDLNIASSSRPHESAPDLFTSTNVEDDTMGGSFHSSPPRSTQASPEGTTSGGAEDLDKLTALSSLVSTLVQKVNTQESDLQAHKLMFKEVVGKLVKRVKLLEDKLKAATAAAAASAVPTNGFHEADIPPSSFVPTDEFAGGSDVPAGATTGPSTVYPSSTTVPTTSSVPVAAQIPAGSGTTPESPSSPVRDAKKGKGIAIDKPSPTQHKTFKQLEEEQLGWEAAERLQAQELADFKKQRAESLMKDANLARQMSQDFDMTEAQRKRQQEVLASAANYSDAAWDIILAPRMVELVNTQRKELAEQRAQERRDRPMTPSQLRQYMRTYVKNQGPAVYSTGWTMAQTRTSSKKLKTGGDDVNLAATSHGVPQEEAGATPSPNVSQEEVATPSHSHDILDAPVKAPFTTASTAQHTGSSPTKVGTRKKRLGRKGVHPSHSTIPIEDGDPEAENKMCIKYASDVDSASDDDTPVNLFVVIDWELLSTGLGYINVFYRKDNSCKCFTSLREILHLVTRVELMTIYGRMMTFYQDEQAAGVGLVLWGDLKVLIDLPDVNDGIDVWKNQHTWSIQSWKLYSYSGVHVLETVGGLVLHMFVDKKYPLSINLIERMLDHQLEICPDIVGNELTTAIQLIAFLKKQISDSRRPKVTQNWMVFTCHIHEMKSASPEQSAQIQRTLESVSSVVFISSGAFMKVLFRKLEVICGQIQSLGVDCLGNFEIDSFYCRESLGMKIDWMGRNADIKNEGSVNISSDEELEELMKDQLLPADASPIALSSGYISDSDPEEDDEEDQRRILLTILPTEETMMIMSHLMMTTMIMMSDCPELKNQNHENGGTGARRCHLIPNPKPRSRDTSLVALGQSAINLARQKSYADVRRKPAEFQVDNLVGPFKGLERVESIAYKLKLPQELSRVHNAFHVSNLKKCCSDDPLAIPLEGLHIDDKFHLVEEPVVIMDRDIKRLKSKPYPNC